MKRFSVFLLASSLYASLVGGAQEPPLSPFHEPPWDALHPNRLVSMMRDEDARLKNDGFSVPPELEENIWQIRSLHRVTYDLNRLIEESASSDPSTSARARSLRAILRNDGAASRNRWLGDLNEDGQLDALDLLQFRIEMQNEVIIRSAFHLPGLEPIKELLESSLYAERKFKSLDEDFLSKDDVLSIVGTEQGKKLLRARFFLLRLWLLQPLWKTAVQMDEKIRTLLGLHSVALPHDVIEDFRPTFRSFSPQSPVEEYEQFISRLYTDLQHTPKWFKKYADWWPAQRSLTLARLRANAAAIRGNSEYFEWVKSKWAEFDEFEAALARGEDVSTYFSSSILETQREGRHEISQPKFEFTHTGLRLRTRTSKEKLHYVQVQESNLIRALNSATGPRRPFDLNPKGWRVDAASEDEVGPDSIDTASLQMPVLEEVIRIKDFFMSLQLISEQLAELSSPFINLHSWRQDIEIDPNQEPTFLWSELRDLSEDTLALEAYTSPYAVQMMAIEAEGHEYADNKFEERREGLEERLLVNPDDTQAQKLLAELLQNEEDIKKQYREEWGLFPNFGDVLWTAFSEEINHDANHPYYQITNQRKLRIRTLLGEPPVVMHLKGALKEIDKGWFKFDFYPDGKIDHRDLTELRYLLDSLVWVPVEQEK